MWRSAQHLAPAAAAVSTALLAPGSSNDKACARLGPGRTSVNCAEVSTTGAVLCVTGIATAGFFGGWLWTGRGRATSTSGEDRLRLQKLLREGKLIHPADRQKANLIDLAYALSICRGVEEPESRSADGRQDVAKRLAAAIGGEARKHIVLVLCDGMGCSILDEHLESSSFLRTANDPNRLVSVFPSTTPTALTSLATASWPSEHGVPGWDLREQRFCEFPGENPQSPVQLRILHPFFADYKTMKPLEELKYKSADLFLRTPVGSGGKSPRESLYVSAYQGTDFTNWSEAVPHQEATISETVAETLGTPEGSEKAIAYFHQGVDAVLQGVRAAEKEGRKSFVYLYTAHPDKHMHALGVEHDEVKAVVRGIDSELERLWRGLAGLDAALVVTADHGHVTVRPEDMVTLPDELLDCLEYANIGVHGKGRHAYFHCKAGRQDEFQELWGRSQTFREKFLLLSIEDAAEEGLFGLEARLPPRVRPRVGDFVALSLGAPTLASPRDATKYRDCKAPRCQGAHGSLTSEEMRVPFVLCTSRQKQ